MLKIRFRILFAVLLLQAGIVTHAQGNLPYRDDKFFHFGFSLGTNFMDFGIGANPGDSVNVSYLKPGFSVGIITDLRLNRYLNLRFTPTLNIGERDLVYLFDGKQDVVTVPSIPICIPLYLKYSSERYGNLRPYLIGGGGMYVDLGQNKDKPVYLNTLDFYTEFGVGCDIYFSFFKLAPELKFAIGYNDLFVPISQRQGGQLSPADEKFSNALSKLTSRVLTLTFNFE
ncbi:MAG: outer membrane beta-barrel protein [Paludibacter sp.]|nr:outer membrane beta-barrel protein [Paludibacter sp.]